MRWSRSCGSFPTGGSRRRCGKDEEKARGRLVSFRRQSERVALVDEIAGLEFALEQALRAIPIDLMLDIARVDPRLGIDIGDAGFQLLRRLADRFGEDRRDRRRVPRVAVFLAGPCE